MPSQFDIFDDEKEFGPQPAPVAQKSLADQFADLSAAEDEKLKPIQADAEKQNTIADWAGVLNHIPQSRSAAEIQLGIENSNKIDTDALRKGANRKLTDAQAAKKAALASLLQKDQLQYQDVERGRAAEDHSMKTESHGLNTEKARFGLDQDKTSAERRKDPNSALALQARRTLAQQYGMAPESLQDFNYEEMLEIGRQISTASKAGGGGKYQQTTIEIPGKGVFKATFNPDTGEYKLTDFHAGYKLETHGNTGTKHSGASYDQPAVDIQTEDGGSVADRQTELTGDRAEASSLGSAAGKAGSEAAAAQGSLEKWDKTKQHILDLAAKAEKDWFGLGLGGRVGGTIAEKTGFSASEAGDELDAFLTADLNQYIKDTTGLTMTEGEAARLERVRPTRGDSPALFKIKMKAFMDTLDSTIQQKIRQAQVVREGAQAQGRLSSPEAPPAPKMIKVSNGAETYEIPVEALQEAEADGFQRID